MGGVKPETIAAAQAQLLSIIKRPATSPAPGAPPAKRSHLQGSNDGPLAVQGEEAILGNEISQDDRSCQLRAPEPLSIKEWQPAPDNDLPKGVIDGPDTLGADGEDDDFDEGGDVAGGAPGSRRPPRPPPLVPPQGLQWPGPMSLNSPLALDAQSLLMALNMSNPMLGLPGELPAGWPAVTSPPATLGEEGGGSAASTPSGSSAMGSPSQAPLLFFMPQMHLMNPLLMGSLLSTHAAAQHMAAAQAGLQLNSAMEDMLKQMPNLQLPANFPKLDHLPSVESWAAFANSASAKGALAHGMPAGLGNSAKGSTADQVGSPSSMGAPRGSSSGAMELQSVVDSSSGRRQSDSDSAAAQAKQAASIMALRGSLLAYIHEAEEPGQPPKQQQQQQQLPAGARQHLMLPPGAIQQAAFPAGATSALQMQAAFPAGATGAMPLPHNPLGIFPMGAWMQQQQMQQASAPQAKPQQAGLPAGAVQHPMQLSHASGLSHASSLSLGVSLQQEALAHHVMSPGAGHRGSALHDLPLPPPIHAEPAVIKSHGGKPKRTVDLDALRLVYDLPINEAAKKLGLGRTVLKKYCRRLNIPRWPYRKLKSMDKLIEVVEEYSRQDPTTSECMQAVLKELRHFRQLIFLDPAIDLEARIKRLRQANFKLEHKLRTMWRQLSNDTSNSGGRDDDGDGSD